MVLQDNQVMRPAFPARRGWEEAFREMAQAGDDRLPMGDELSPTTWEEEEWEWQSSWEKRSDRFILGGGKGKMGGRECQELCVNGRPHWRGNLS